MLLKSDIELTIQLQAQFFRYATQQTIKREAQSYFDDKSTAIEMVSGIRRSGKSTLLRHLHQSETKETLFLNFEDPRIFHFELNDFSKLDEILGDSISTYFFDEIQNVENWEIYIRQLHDRGKKVFVTGSNASLLSKDLGTRLTGRHINHELFPFSYSEFLEFHQLPNTAASFNEYLEKGGFPEYNRTEQPSIVQTLFTDILQRDIAVRYHLKNTRQLMEVALFLISNIGKEQTYNRIKKSFGFGSANTVSDYIQWMNDAYLFFFVPRFSWSAKNELISPRKVYGIDTALIRLNSLSYSKDVGRLLENAVYLHFRRQPVDIFYFRENKECDFIITDKRNCTDIIQVCAELNADNRYRELEGLEEAMKVIGKNEGFIITINQKDELMIDNKKIYIIPANEFFTKIA